MESRMLEDIKPKIKPEVTETDETKTEPSIRLKTQTQAWPCNVSNTQKLLEEPQKPLTNFGWAVFDKRQAIPFVRRESEGYVAKEIYLLKLLPDFFNVLSKQILECITLKEHLMTQSEADVFNEINVIHCDRSLVGNHHFKEGECMFYLEDMRRYIKFLDACRNAMCLKKFQNDLFGFLKIGKESDVPFVWNEGKKLVPLFYFDGQSEYLEARSVDLTDMWKFGYLQFCFLVQNIRKNHYEKTPLKVVDFGHIKELFPVDTAFELHWPEKVNEDLLTPEVRLAALHGMYDISALPLRVPSTSNLSNRISSEQSMGPFAYTSSAPTLTGPQPVTHSTQTHISNCQITSFPTNIRVPATNQSSLVNTSLPQKRSFGSTTVTSTVAKKCKRQNDSQSQGKGEVTNVPYRSPQAASSPELRFSSPPIIEAVTSIPPINTQAQINQRSSVITDSSWYKQSQKHSTPNVCVLPTGGFSQHSNTVLNQNFNQQSSILQIIPLLRHSMRDFFVRRLRSMDWRMVECRMGEIAWSFMIEHKITCRMKLNELLPAIQAEMWQLWTELKHNSTLWNMVYGNNQVSGMSIFQNVQNSASSNNATNVVNVNRKTNHSIPPIKAYSSQITTGGNHIPDSETSRRRFHTQPQRTSNGYITNNNALPKVEVIKHVELGWPDGQAYTIKECHIRGKNILGISMSPIINEFLVNFSDFAEKCLQPKDYERFSLWKFKRLFSLNNVQNMQWQKLVQSGHVQCSGGFKHIFVLYNEILGAL